jgi:hypothetical protein
MQTIVYHFHFSDGSNASISVAGKKEVAESFPDWTALAFHQCSNCPLNINETPRCPMAVSFVKLVSVFGQRQSYETVDTQVDMAERTITKTTTVQRAVGSLMGLLAAASECPRAAFLKPMAHFHLPFSSEEETIYRVTSTYLLSQYFLEQENPSSSWDFEPLKQQYRELQVVNAAMANRLRSLNKTDGTINALVLLDLLAKALPYSIDDALEELQPIFQPLPAMANK